MRHTDIAIVGGGFAGSLAAAMLLRSGIDALLVDPHRVYPPDFRSEKLDGEQIGMLAATGMLEPVRRAGTPYDVLSIARGGRIVDRKPYDQFGIAYDTLVNTVRAQISPADAFIVGKVADVALGGPRQALALASGDAISARLVVLANGLNIGLRRRLGMANDVVSARHSVSVGFDMVPVGGATFGFSALTYYPEHAGTHVAYLALFPIGSTFRANLFVYREPRDPWIAALRAAPQETLFAAMPGLRRLLGGFRAASEIKIRPVDLAVTRGYRQDGIVLAGDAFATSCPAAGTGCDKVLTDVTRLCAVHVPRWLATPGMGAEKIASFYDDADKRACDDHSLQRAFALRAATLDSGLAARARRQAKFVAHFGMGTLRRLRDWRPPLRPAAATPPSSPPPA